MKPVQCPGLTSTGDPKRFSERSFVTVDTDETGKDHVLIPPSALLHGLRLAPATLVFDLESRLRCRECGRLRDFEPAYVCEHCFGPLEVAYDYEAIAASVSRRSIPS